LAPPRRFFPAHLRLSEQNLASLRGNDTDAAAGGDASSASGGNAGCHVGSNSDTHTQTHSHRHGVLGWLLVCWIGSRRVPCWTGTAVHLGVMPPHVDAGPPSPVPCRSGSPWRGPGGWGRREVVLLLVFSAKAPQASRKIRVRIRAWGTISEFPRCPETIGPSCSTALHTCCALHHTAAQSLVGAAYHTPN